MSDTSTNLISCPTKLGDDQKEQFRTEGYLAFSNVLSPEETAAARRALARITAELSGDPQSKYRPPAEGKGNQKGATYVRPDSPSMLQLEPGFDPEGKSVEEIDRNVRKYMWFSREDPVFQKMVLPGSPLHGVVASILGTDPVLFQEMALVKPAHLGCEKPWHQDNAYFSVEPLDAILGVWIALDDAKVENGCMHVIPGGHKLGGLKHHHGSDCEIDPSLLEVEKSVPVPIPAGGAMFFYGMLPHETPPNRSASRRRALQFHYRGANTRIIDEEAYDRLFIDRKGAPASCRAASALGF